MKSNITELNVLAFIYGELSQKESLEVFEAIKNDPDIYSFYAEAQQIRQMMDLTLEQPSPTTLDIVLEHSHDSFTESV